MEIWSTITKLQQHYELTIITSKKVKEALAQDQIAQNIQENLNNKENFKEQDNILTYQELVYLSAFYQKKLVNKFHGAQPYSYQRSTKTLKQIPHI